MTDIEITVVELDPVQIEVLPDASSEIVVDGESVSIEILGDSTIEVGVETIVPVQIDVEDTNISVEVESSIIEIDVKNGGIVIAQASEIGITPIPGITSDNVQGALEELSAENVSYTHIQSTPASVWTINHNLGRYPVSIQVLDSGGTVCWGSIQQITINQTVISFGAQFSGIARLR